MLKIKSKIIGLCLLSLVAVPFLHSTNPKSKIVRIYKEGKGMCSGEQVQGASGTNYILTAGHCAVFIEDGSVDVETEDHKKLKRHVVAEDPNSDLMLIEGLPGIKGFSIANAAYPADWVKTITHGWNLDTYQTEGTLIQISKIDAPLFSIEEGRKCTGMAKLRQEGEYCIMSVWEMISTAMIVPGSSGGAVLNNDNELVGVVSCGSPPFSDFVTLSDIKAFLKNY